MPEYYYSDAERAFIEAADGKFTVAEVAAKIGRSESAVYQMALRLGVKFKPKPSGSLVLLTRGAFVIPEGELAFYQRVVTRIGEHFGLTSKNAVFLKALYLADILLNDYEDD
jgi:hypothetical protein